MLWCLNGWRGNERETCGVKGVFVTDRKARLGTWAGWIDMFA